MNKKRLVEALIEFKKKHNPIQRSVHCPFCIPYNVGYERCKECRTIFPRLTKRQSEFQNSQRHICPCRAYKISYVKKVVQKFIKDWR